MIKTYFRGDCSGKIVLKTRTRGDWVLLIHSAGAEGLDPKQAENYREPDFLR